MTGSVIYKVPELQTLSVDSYDEVPAFTPETTVLDMGEGRSSRFIRVYRWCYLDRCAFDESLTSRKKRYEVNLRSLCPKRASLVKLIIGHYLIGKSGLPRSQDINYVLNWIDREGRADELYDLDVSRELYRNFTELLRHRIRLPKVGEPKSGALGNTAAQGYQTAMAYVCAVAQQLDRATVMSWAIKIPQKIRGKAKLPAPKTTASEHVLAHELHKRFFEAFSAAVIKNTTPPVIVELEDLGFPDLVYYSDRANSANGWSALKHSQRTDWIPYFYRREGVFSGTPKAFNELLIAQGLEPIDTSSFKRMQNANIAFGPAQRRELSNHAVRHFGYLLLAEAGNNAAHLASIDCTRGRLDRALGANRTLAVKPRAGHEEQDQFVDVRFAQTTWKRYIQLRELMASSIHAPETGLFLLTYQGGLAPYTLLNADNMRMLPLWPHGAPTLQTRPARKHKSINLMEGTGGNIALVSALQAATPETIARHYIFKNESDAIREMCAYFQQQAEAAKLRFNGVEPVRIIEVGDPTTTGHCDADEQDGPRLLEGYEGLGIEPRCSAPITCMFCAHFGLHADQEDILRLLTIKKWIEVQSRLVSSSIDEHMQKYLPFVERIDEVLEAFPVVSESHAALVEEAQGRFKRGERDPYWGARINGLLEIEEE